MRCQETVVSYRGRSKYPLNIHTLTDATRQNHRLHLHSHGMKVHHQRDILLCVAHASLLNLQHRDHSC